MIKLGKIMWLGAMILIVYASSWSQQNYLEYHQQISRAELLICEESFEEALDTYNSVFKSYNYVFVRDYKNAAQIAWYLKDTLGSIEYILKGVQGGWNPKYLKKNKFIQPLFKTEQWKLVKDSISIYSKEYSTEMDQILRDRVHEMFKKDQNKALAAFLKIGESAKLRYNYEKFAPHSEQNMAEAIDILETSGYPGEKLIGNNYWMSTIMSHHNSIAPDYNRQDTIYKSIKPALKEAVIRGEMSPYEYALIEDWYLASAMEAQVPGYGYVVGVNQASINKSNELRQSIGLRTVELRNGLVDVEIKTGMNLYLPDWLDGKITIN